MVTFDCSYVCILGQSLEDVDISVHCDVTIFEWLMDWLKAQSKDETICNNNEEESGTNELQQEPELTPNNVVSILVSASFLKMGPLVDFALTYLHHNMNKVLVTTHNLNCLGEPLLTRWALYSNLCWPYSRFKVSI